MKGYRLENPSFSLPPLFLSKSYQGFLTSLSPPYLANNGF